MKKKLFLLLCALLTVMVVSAQTRTIHGTVVAAADNEPLVGATVVPVGGNGHGTATDIDGNFAIVIGNNVKELKVSYVGMQTVNAAVSNGMVVRLEVSANNLDEVVVTGYGSGKKLGSIVGSVAKVGEEVFKNTPSSNFVDALQGQVAGLNIFSSSGEPSAVPSSVRIRGVNSIEAGNTPLYILDGAPVSSTIFTTLNPSDIESITVLKDAVSTAVYGSRAANGVIVITSKKGKFGEKAKVTIGANYGWSSMVADRLDMMNSSQYVQYRDLIGQPVSDEARMLVEKYGVDTDWRSVLFDDNAPTYSVTATVQGGTDKTSYYIGLNHYDQDGVAVQSGMRRTSLRSNLTSQVNDWFRLDFKSNLGFTRWESNYFSDNSMNNNWNNPMAMSRWMYPYQPSNYYSIDEDGNIQWGDEASYYWMKGAFNPKWLASTRDFYRNRITGNIVLAETISPIKGLNIRAQQAVDAYDQRLNRVQYPQSNFVTPMGTTAPASSLTGWNYQSFTRYYSFTYTNTAEYRFNIDNKHNVSLLAGQESIISKSSGFGVETDGQTDYRQMLLTNGTTVTMSDVAQSLSESVFNSFFFTGSYDFDNRYFIDASYRRDGSSKFAPGHRWANFWSVGAMWNIKAENFLKPYTWLDDLKLSVSYGTTGNSSIDNYMYYGTLGSGSLYNGQSSLGISNAPNYDLTWETVKSFDLGLKIGLINHLDLDVDFYKKKTCDMLMEIPYSYTTGYDSGYGNIGSMTNTGVDVEFNASIVNTRDWYVGARVNFNYNKNEITELFNGQSEYTLANYGMQLAVGHPYGELYYTRYAGVDPRDGKQMWYDKNGNLTKTYSDDDKVLLGKSLYAPWTGGWGIDARWKDLSLRMDWNWAAKKYMLNNELYFVQNSANSTSMNQTTAMLNIWTTPGQVTDIPAYGESVQFDDRWVEDASYMRLKNLTIQYNLPRTLIKSSGLQNVALHFTGRNLITITGYKGYDPEPEKNLVLNLYPNTRQYEFGVEVTF
jgi:TonB-linked SusC/RagA family outer membrane protein